MKKFLATMLLLTSSHFLFAQLEKGMLAVGLNSGITTSKNENETNYSNDNPNYYYSYTVKTKNFQIAPEINYFISKRFSIGLQIGYSAYISTDETTNKLHADSSVFILNSSTQYDYFKNTSAGIDIAPNIKYYVPLSEHIYFLLQGSYSLSLLNGKNSGYDEKTTYDANGNVINYNKTDSEPAKTKDLINSVSINPGVLFMPSSKIGLQFLLGNFIGMSSSSYKATGNKGSTTKLTSTDFEFINFNTLSINTGIYYFF